MTPPDPQIAVGDTQVMEMVNDSASIWDKATGAHVFHAGTALHEGRLVTNGGRILNVVGTGATVEEARNAAYDAIAHIDFAGMHFRSDIAHA